MFYVYYIASIAAPDRRYIGFTEDLRQRLPDHNEGRNPATAGIRWLLKGYVAFGDKSAALAVEPYLKSGSSHAFAKRRL